MLDRMGRLRERATVLIVKWFGALPTGSTGFGMGYVSRFAVSRFFLDLSSAKTSQHSCSAGQAAVLVVKSVQDGAPHHPAGPFEAMSLASRSRTSALSSSLSPQANALCERLIGTLRRKCLDWIPINRGPSATNSVVVATALQSRPDHILR